MNQLALLPPETSATRPLLRVRGGLDLATADALLEDVRRLARVAPGGIDLDLDDVEFMDSSGAKCLMAAKAAHDLRLRSASRSVRRVLRLLGLEAELLPCGPGGSP